MRIKDCSIWQVAAACLLAFGLGFVPTYVWAADAFQFRRPSDNTSLGEIDTDGNVTFRSSHTASAYFGDGANLTSVTAATADALSANGTNCSANQFNKGVDASGNAESCAALADADIPDSITIDLAATATALASNGANCSAGSAPLGVDASGAAESCTDYVDVAGDTMSGVLTASDGSQSAPGIAMNGDANTGVDSLTADQLALIAGGVVAATATTSGLDAVGYTEAGSNTLSNDISGNAGTATALATNGANCSAGSAPLGVDASGAAESCTDFIGTGGGETIGGTLSIGSTALEVKGSDTNANICADSCANGAGRCIYVSTTDFDVYSSTGLGAGDWRNGRTGIGPC